MFNSIKTIIMGKKHCNENRDKKVSKKEKIRELKEAARERFNAPPPKFCFR